MSYQLNEKSSLETILEYVVGVSAALGAKNELAPLVTPWEGLRGDLRKARDERDESRYATRVAAARVRVADAEWDGHVGIISGRAYLAAGKQAKSPPYSLLFGSVTASDARRLGAHKAAAFGTRLAGRIKELANPELLSQVEPFMAANTELQAAADRWTVAREAELAHEVRRVRLLEKVEQQIALCEVEILSRFPGRRDLVAAILSPYVGRSRPDTDEPAKPAPESEGPAGAAPA